MDIEKILGKMRSVQVAAASAGLVVCVAGCLADVHPPDAQPRSPNVTTGSDRPVPAVDSTRGADAEDADVNGGSAVELEVVTNEIANGHDPEIVRPVRAVTAHKIWEPLVRLTDAHAKSCLLNVGDPMPPITLLNTEGEEHSLASYYGEKLTVVVFWSIRHPYASEQFSHLGPDIADRYAGHGVNVVAINEGDAGDEVRQIVEETDVDFPCLLDTDGSAFRHVATSILPRTYLLDTQGEVLWLDIEYSRSTRRELHNAMRYYLKP